MERRRSPRLEVHFSLVFDDGNAFDAGVISNVSDVGLFLATIVPFPIGTVVRLRPAGGERSSERPSGRTEAREVPRSRANGAGPPGCSSFDIEAKVVRTTAGDENEQAGMGLEFVETSIDGRAPGELIRALAYAEARDSKLIVQLPAAPEHSHDDRDEAHDHCCS